MRDFQIYIECISREEYDNLNKFMGDNMGDVESAKKALIANLMFNPIEYHITFSENGSEISEIRVGIEKFQEDLSDLISTTGCTRSSLLALLMRCEKEQEDVAFTDMLEAYTNKELDTVTVVYEELSEKQIHDAFHLV